MTNDEMKDYLLKNKDSIHIETHQCLDGNAKPGSSDAVFLGHQPRIGNIALCDPSEWFRSAEEAIKVGNENLDEFLNSGSTG